MSAVAAPELDVAEERRLVDELSRPAAMASRLATVAGVEATSPCRVLDMKYEARRSCTVLYLVGTVPVTVVAALAGPPPGGAEVTGGMAIGPATTAHAYPADPVLTSLPGLLAPGAMAAALGQALGGTVVTCRTEVLRYRPARRATFDVRAHVRHGGATVPRHLIAKVYSNPAKAAAVYDESLLLAPLLAGAGSTGRAGDDGPGPDLLVASPVAFLPEVPMILQSPVGGVDLESLLTRSPSGRPDRRAPAGVAAAAGALAALHRLAPVSHRVRSAGKELDRFERRATRIAAVAPAVGARLLAVRDALADARERLPAGPEGLVHGDCKPSQFLVADSTIALLDFDHCGLADPASDVGAFLAALRKSSVIQSRHGPPPPRPAEGSSSRRLEQAFLETYGRCADDQLALEGAGLLESRVRWHQAASLVRKALRAFARAPRSPLAVALADEAERCLRPA